MNWGLFALGFGVAFVITLVVMGETTIPERRASWQRRWRWLVFLITRRAR